MFVPKFKFNNKENYQRSGRILLIKFGPRWIVPISWIWNEFHQGRESRLNSRCQIQYLCFLRLEPHEYGLGQVLCLQNILLARVHIYNQSFNACNSTSHINFYFEWLPWALFTLWPFRDLQNLLFRFIMNLQKIFIVDITQEIIHHMWYILTRLMCCQM